MRAKVETILERLTRLHPKKIDMSLARMDHVLKALGDPHLQLAPVIHVAGTNGKGSTTAFMRAMLEAAGKRVHVYTSPHLVSFNERFRLAAPGGGQLVDDDTLGEILLEVEARNGDAPITQFEITTAAGFLLFARRPADVVLLEVGMGGRLDATNVVPRPRATAIAPVSMDHAEYLGDTVAKIAGEKAGVIKRGRPCVVARQKPEAMRVIEAAADHARARLSVAGLDWFAREENGRFVFQDDDGLFEAPAPRLPGAHQFENAGLAVATLKAAGFPPSLAEVETGLARVHWPARLQRLTGRLSNLLPAGAELWLDGGHNEGGGEVLSAAIERMGARDPRPLVMICGMISTKDPRAFLAHFQRLKPLVLTTPFAYPAALGAVDLAEAATEAGLEAAPTEGLEAALRTAGAQDPGRPPRVLVTGSLYLAGEALAADGWTPS